MFNRHKLRKKVSQRKRIYKKSKHALHGKNRKDFAWQGKNDNPMREKKNALSLKVKAQLFMLFCIVLTCLGVILYHPFFHIDEISITGIERITQHEILEAVQGALAYKKYGVLPASNYALLETATLEHILSDRFPINAVTIQKEFPNTIHIEIEERLSTLIYDDGSTYYFMGRNGKIIEPIQKVTAAEWKIQTETVTSTNDLGEVIEETREVSRHHTPDVDSLARNLQAAYPIVYSYRDQDDLMTMHTQVLTESHVESLIDWYTMIDTHHSLEMRYMDITQPHKTVVHTQSLNIHINILGESEEQIERLEAALQEIQLSDAVSYIDVRYPGRVYWK